MSRVIRRLSPWLMLLGLVVASILLWQTRFHAVPHVLNGDAGFEQGLDGWVIAGGLNGLRTGDGSTVARFARPARDGEFSSAARWLGSLEELRYLQVEVEARWSDVIGGKAVWARPRLVMVTKDQQGSILRTLDRAAYLALGSRDWHREETVFELTPEMSEVGLVFQMLGKEGTMEVRRFRVTALHQRRWVPAATVLMVVGWILWLGRRLQGPTQGISRRRAILAAVVVAGASWYLVFPGPRMRAHPLIGSFLTGEAGIPEQVATAPEPPPPTSATSVDKPSRTDVPGTDLRTAADQPTAGGAVVSLPETIARPSPKPLPATATPPPEPRSHSAIAKLVHRAGARVNALHLFVFFTLSLSVFLVTGSLTPWRLLGAVSILSEAIPNWHNSQIDAADLLDLGLNFAGVALAACAFLMLERLAERNGESGFVTRKRMRRE